MSPFTTVTAAVILIDKYDKKNLTTRDSVKERIKGKTRLAGKGTSLQKVVSVTLERVRHQASCLLVIFASV